jgi:type IV pilus assembly protein PilA
MNANFKAKFLQNFVSKKKGNEGFTLIELLVVIIIVGVLAAIALPSFLNQIGKARASEGKSSVGTINRAQQAYRLESKVFSSKLTDLDAKISGKFYSYTVGAGTAAGGSVATTNTTAVDGPVKNYGGAVAQTGDFFGQAICEGKIAANVAAAAPAATAPIAAGTSGSCANGTSPIE